MTVDNDTFALLRAGTDAEDAIGVICGTGINVVGRAAGGRVARYSSLGWETGDWGGAVMLGREVLRLAARGRTVAATRLRSSSSCAHFSAATVEQVGADIYYGRLPQSAARRARAAGRRSRGRGHGRAVARRAACG